MKAKCIQTKLSDSYKAYWIKWKLSAFKQSLLNQMNDKCIHTMPIDSKQIYW